MRGDGDLLLDGMVGMITAKRIGLIVGFKGNWSLDLDKVEEN